jgi:TonB family protein
MNRKPFATGIRWIVLAIALLGIQQLALAQSLKKVTQAQANSAVTVKQAPEYSMIARQLKLTGAVLVNVYISEDGSVERVESVSGNPVLFKCVEPAVAKWKFTPFSENGKVVKAVAALTFNFGV